MCTPTPAPVSPSRGARPELVSWQPLERFRSEVSPCYQGFGGKGPCRVLITPALLAALSQPYALKG